MNVGEDSGHLRVGVTGARGRVGRALIRALEASRYEAIAWSRPDYDLDGVGSGRRVIERDAPQIVIHAAAWTDREGCDQYPDVANRRNAQATAELATLSAAIGARFVLISCGDVFDGRRTDEIGYDESDKPSPTTVYGRSKLAAETAARRVFVRAGRSSGLLIVRTGIVFGPGGDGLVERIASGGQHDTSALPREDVFSVAYSVDLATAVTQLISARAPAGTYHLVNRGGVTLRDIAERMARGDESVADDACPARRDVLYPPKWTVLGTSMVPRRFQLRRWDEALDDYLAVMGR